LITISPSGERWESKWNCDYVLTLSDLELDYLAADGEQETEVNVFLTSQQVTYFFFSLPSSLFLEMKDYCTKALTALKTNIVISVSY
jgi:hypothetical protein